LNPGGALTGPGLGAPGAGGVGGASAGALPTGFPMGWGTLGEGPFFPPLTIFWLAMLNNKSETEVL